MRDIKKRFMGETGLKRQTEQTKLPQTDGACADYHVQHVAECSMKNAQQSKPGALKCFSPIHRIHSVASLLCACG